ncbi:hypothetical protein FT663_04415 [Candidozyma haemuli var. vulneris]|nr:hypothetical protein FT663_04415 [[Candida] haemuloni var. vulneris]KAF3991001.1 hypothetical protein FT662_01937 [[Candida] haemuloni var. vulneris]
MQRITSLDLQILTGELRESILNYRLQNIYNVANSARQYVLKFGLPDSKKSLVLDCGNKLHLSDFERPIAPAPSNFVTKLRKHLKSRRLSNLKQLRNDRVLVFEFSDGQFYLVLEFFSAGNMLLLDEEMKILSLQRLVTNTEAGNDKYAVNETYRMFDKSLFAEEASYQKTIFTSDTVKDWAATHKQKLVNDTSEKKKKKVFSIHKLAFVNASHLSSDLILKALAEVDVSPTQSCLEVVEDQDKLDQVVEALNLTETRYEELLSNIQNEKVRGVIVEKKNNLHDPSNPDSLEFVYEEFHPFVPFKSDKKTFRFQEVDGYNKTLDKFFTTLESTKYALRIEQQKQHAQKRLDTAKNERDRQIQSLQIQSENNEKKGNTIIYHADLVEDCKSSIQELLNKQTDWEIIEKLTKMEQSKGNKVAKTIRLPLNLKEGKIKLALPDPDSFQEEEEVESDASSASSDSESSSEDESSSESEDESSESDSDSSDSDSDSEFEESQPKKKKKAPKSKAQPSAPTVNVDIDLTLSAFANARLYFDSKKTADSKQTKVEQNTQFALKNAERKIQKDLAKNLKKETDELKAIRPKFWFEKFFWFVTSDGYLCLSGRDDLQTDMIYYRHFSDNDYYVSSDVEGSLKVFIKNPFKGKPLSPSTLFQAGIFALSTSAAWNGKSSSSSYWMAGDGISKKDIDGTLLGPGRLNLKGKKNLMPPAQLVMGFGLYWLVDEETNKKYTEARVSKQEEHGLQPEVSNKKKDLENLNLAAIFTDREKESNEQEGTENVESKEEEEEEDGTAPQEDESTPSGPSNDNEVENITSPLSKANVRGKKGKLKKINAKYADQDEEEKLIRMEALGTLKQIQEREKQQEAEAKRKAEQEKERYADKGAERSRAKEARQLKKYLQDDEDGVDVAFLEQLDSLLPRAAKDDVVGAFVPVFAPWSALSKFKYKVKIQPGFGKKGKSVTEAISYFSNRKVDASKEDAELDWPEEHEMLKGAKSNDISGVFTVSKVKLVLPGSNGGDKGKGGKGSGKGGGKGGAKKGGKKK